MVYKKLHHASNTNPKWFGINSVWVSILNNCDYCILHSFEGLKRLLNNDAHKNKVIFTE